jgi:hypothetical protein
MGELEHYKHLMQRTVHGCAVSFFLLLCLLLLACKCQHAYICVVSRCIEEDAAAASGQPHLWWHEPLLQPITY